MLMKLPMFFVWALCVTQMSNVFAQEVPTNPSSISVSSVKAKTGVIYDWVLAEGLAQGIRREYLNFESGGKVTFIARDQKGLPVREGSFVYGPSSGSKLGQLLASVDERADSEALKQSKAELQTAKLRTIQAKSQLVRAQNNLELTESDFARTKVIWEKKLISKKQFDVAQTERLNSQEALRSAEAELEAAKSQELSVSAQLNQAKVKLEKASIYAPFDGVLRTVNIRKGDYISGPGMVTSDREREKNAAMVVVDNSQYEITLNIPSYLGDKLSENQSVYIGLSPAAISEAAQTQFTHGQVVEGSVFSVSPSISLAKRAIEVKVHTTNGAELLKDGLYVSAWILADKKEDAVVLPYSALVMRDNKSFVYVLDRLGKANLTRIKTGITGHYQIEVLQGLKPGMEVVTTGNHKLVDGTPVRVVEGLDSE